MVDLLDELYPHSCTVVRRTQSTANAVGQSTYSEASTTGVRCQYQDGGGRELARRYVALVKNAKVFFPAATAIGQDDEIEAIVDAAGEAVASGRHRVVKIQVFHGDHLEVEIEKIG